MEAEQNQINAQILTLWKAALIIMSFILLALSILAFIAFKFHSRLLALFLFSIFGISLLYIVKKLKAPFINNATFTFYAEKIEIQVFKRTSKTAERSYVVPYNQILAFRTFDSSRDEDTSILRLKLRDGRKISFDIVNQTERKISQLTLNYIKNYNKTVSVDKRITLLPTFFSTKAGLVCLIVTLMANVTVLIFGLMNYNFKIMLDIVTCFSITILLFFQRSKDLKALKEWETA